MSRPGCINPPNAADTIAALEQALEPYWAARAVLDDLKRQYNADMRRWHDDGAARGRPRPKTPMYRMVKDPALQPHRLALQAAHASRTAGCMRYMIEVIDDHSSDALDATARWPHPYASADLNWSEDDDVSA